MLIRFLILCSLIVIPFKAQAGLVFGAFGGQAYDNGDGIDKLKGSVAGGKVGWRWRWLALEVAQSSYNMKTKAGQRDDFYVQKAELKGSATDLMLRFYPFSFLSLVAGVSSLNVKGDIELTNIDGDSSRSASLDGDLYDNGSLVGIGLHIPIGKGFEIFGELMRRKWTSIAPTFGEPTPDLVLTEWHAGLTWTWDTIGSKRSSKDD